jgi:hypothetical protein
MERYQKLGCDGEGVPERDSEMKECVGIKVAVLA